MMSALPQMPTQTGLASILAALGPATAGGSEDGGFEQLFASLPSAAAAMLAATTTIDTSVVAVLPEIATQPITATPLPVVAPTLPQVAAAEPATPATATPEAAPAPETDSAAADAASLLIAVASPYKTARPVAEKAMVTTPAETNEGPESDKANVNKLGSEASVATPAVAATPAAIDTPAPAAPVAADIAPTPEAIPVSAAPIAAALPIAAAPVVAAIIAPAGSKPVGKPVADAPAAEAPITDQPVADSAAKPLPTTATPRRDAAAASDAPAPTAKTIEAARPQPAAIAAPEPKAAKPMIDTGASMSVLFTQPELQGASPLVATAKAAPVAERVLDTTSDDQWIAQLAADIAATKSDKGDISFRLMPRHLGRLDVSMLAGDEGVTLKLDTQHEATATIVNAAQPRLVEDLRQQGVRVAGAEVTCTPGEAGRQSQQGQGQGRTAHADTSHLIETASDRAHERGDSPTDERTADRRGRFA